MVNLSSVGTVDLFRDRSIRVAAAAVVIAAAGVVYGARAPSPSGAEAGRAGTTTTTTAPTVEWQGGDGPLAGRTFPELTGVGLDGRPVSTATGGAPLVVVVWEARCRCAETFTSANTAVLRGAGSVGVVGVNLDTDISRAAQRNLDAGLLFPSLSDRSGEVSRATGAIPDGAIVVVAPDGTVVADYRSAPDPQAFAADLEAAFP